MNTDQPSSPEGTQILTYKDNSIRVLIIDKVPYFAVEDICDAVGWDHRVSSNVRSDRFPDFGKYECREETDEGLKETFMVSPIGGWLFTQTVDPYRGQHIAAWMKRQSLEIYPDADPKDPRMFVTMDAKGNLPLHPAKYSGRRSEWHEVKNSQECFNARFGINTDPANSRKELQARLLAEAEARKTAA